MLILSQDKNKIVNLDNVIYITTNTYSEECSGISCNSLNNLEIYLGNYDTEERAKEVLQEIMEKYKEENYAMIETMAKAQLVYEMPKE